MNLVIEGIKKRRSTRSYTGEQVSNDMLKEILDCALMAPSGMDEQGLQFSVIQNEEILAELKRMVGRDFIYGAPTLIVVHCNQNYRYAHSDGGAAIENMYIAANALGLGACWINQLKDHYGDPLLASLGFDTQVIPGSLALGYKNEESAFREINKARIHYIK